MSNKIRIITDSTSEFTQEELKDLNVVSVPLRVLIDGEEYNDGDFSKEEFYDKLKNAKTLPKTSQPSPEAFKKVFKTAQDNGETVIALLIGSALSGTMQAAKIAKDELGYENCHIIDSLNAIGTLQILVYTACKMRDEGATVQQIIDAIEKLKHKVVLYAIVDTLEYLRKGGRLNSATAIIGSILKIKPVVTIDGKIKPIANTIGTKNAVAKVADFIAKNPVDDSYPVIYGYSKTQTALEVLKEKLKEIVDNGKAKLFSVGSIIGVHTGPNCCAIAYVKK